MPDAVRRCATIGCHRRAVLAADSGRLLRVQRLACSARPEKLGMRDVEARVDDRDRRAGGRRRERVDANGGAPPLGRHERVGEVLARRGCRRAGSARCSASAPRARSAGHDRGPRPRRDEVEAERRGDERRRRRRLRTTASVQRRRDAARRASSAAVAAAAGSAGATAPTRRGGDERRRAASPELYVLRRRRVVRAV